MALPCGAHRQESRHGPARWDASGEAQRLWCTVSNLAKCTTTLPMHEPDNCLGDQ
jgi:hypothetical protein